MSNSFIRHLQFSLASLDILVFNTIFFTALFVLQNRIAADETAAYSFFGAFITGAWIVAALVINIYSERVILTFEAFTKRSMQGYFCFLLLVVVYLFFFDRFNIDKAFISVVLISIPVSLLVNRFLYLAIYQYFKKKDYYGDKVLIIGYNTLSKKLASVLEENSLSKEIIGYCAEEDSIDELSTLPILSNLAGAARVCKEYSVTEIYSTIAPEHNPRIYKLIHFADQHCIRFKIVPDISIFVNRQVHLNYLKGMLIISLRNEPLEDMSNRIKKKVFDLLISSAVILFILSWLVPLMAVLIRAGSKGPVFFKQLRTGKDNREFWCIKFRSMRVNDDSDKVQATKYDTRLTPLGKFLRRSNLDEFPQFVNVLRGEMSIVGPRPHMLKHTDEYSAIINKYMVRQFLKPGITGWAQVNGFRGETKTLEQIEGRVACDIWYMENWSLWLDLRIMFMTVFNTIRGEKNAF